MHKIFYLRILHHHHQKSMFCLYKYTYISSISNQKFSPKRNIIIITFPSLVCSALIMIVYLRNHKASSSKRKLQNMIVFVFSYWPLCSVLAMFRAKLWIHWLSRNLYLRVISFWFAWLWPKHAMKFWYTLKPRRRLCIINIHTRKQSSLYAYNIGTISFNTKPSHSFLFKERGGSTNLNQPLHTLYTAYTVLLCKTIILYIC